MDKSNPRARRNGDPTEAGCESAAGEVATTAGGPLAPDPDEGSALHTPAAREARQRIETVAAMADNERSAARRNLQDAFIDERNDVLAVINELEDQLDRHQEARTVLERELTEANEKLQSANQRAQELEWRTVTLQTRVDALEQLRNEVTTLEEELADAAARTQRTNEQLLGLERDRNRLRAELKAAQKQLDELWAVGKERDSLRAEYKLLSTKVEELERIQRETVSERAALQAQLQEAQLALEQTGAERNNLQASLRGAEDRIRELVQVQEVLDDKLESLRTEKKNLQAQLAHLERENARLVEQRQFYECEVTSLRNQSRSAEAALNCVKKAFSEVRIALTETKSRARRRALDGWPRIGTPLRGLPVEGDPADDGDSAPVAAGADQADCEAE